MSARLLSAVSFRFVAVRRFRLTVRVVVVSSTGVSLQLVVRRSVSTSSVRGSTVTESSTVNILLDCARGESGVMSKETLRDVRATAEVETSATIEMAVNFIA